MRRPLAKVLEELPWSLVGKAVAGETLTGTSPVALEKARSLLRVWKSVKGEWSLVKPRRFGNGYGYLGVPSSFCPPLLAGKELNERSPHNGIVDVYVD